MKKFYILASLAFSLSIGASAQAVLEEDFDYGSNGGSLTSLSGGNWVNHSGTAGTSAYQATGLTLSGYPGAGVGGSAVIATGSGEDVNRVFTDIETGTVYASALINISSISTEEYFMHLIDTAASGFGFYNRIYAKDDAGNLKFGIRENFDGVITYSTSNYSYNTTYMLVSKYDIATGTSSLYVSSSLMATEPGVADAVDAAGTNTGAMRKIAMRQPGGATPKGPAASIDGIRVATTWADLVTASVSFTFSNTTSDVTCNGGADGSLTLSVDGGTTPYTYSWSNGQTEATVTGLSAGSQSLNVTVTDAASLVDVAVVNATIAQPSAISLAETITGAACGASDGSIAVVATGGSGTYSSYVWSDGQTDATAINLVSGNYSITATDSEGCVASASYFLSNTNGPSVTITSSDVTCNGGNDGAVTGVDATSGSTVFTYAWSNGETTDLLSGLSAGTLYLTVTDGDGCTSESSVDIGEPTVVSATTTATNESVTGTGNGSASVSASGGSGAGYTYVWSNGATTSSITGLVTGTYSVTVSDANMCSVVKTAAVSANLQILSIYEIQHTTAGNGDSPKNGNSVITRGVVTAYSTWDHSSASRNYRGYFIQDGDSAWSGLFVNDTVNYLGAQPGDTVQVQGTIDEDRYPYWNYTIMKNVTSFTVVSTGGPQATAVQLSTLEANQEKYEGVLVEVTNAVVVDITDIIYGAWSVNDGSGILGVDDIMYGPDTDPALGNKYKVAGVMFSEFNDKTIQPRKPSDITFLSVGLNEFNKGAAKVFPNPTKGLVSLAINNDLNNASYEVYNIAGSRVETSNITTSQTNIDLTHLTSGVYFLKVKNNNQEFVTKLVKE